MTIPLPIIPNTYRCSLIWNASGFGKSAVNVIHIKANASTTTATDAYNAIKNNLSAAMWTFQILSAGIVQVNIIPLDGTSATSTFTTPGGGVWQGQSSGAFVPQVAAIIKLQTGQRGRNKRGRVYLPWVAESQVSAGTLTAGTVNTVQAAWVAFNNGLVGMSPVQWDLGVAAYDRKHDGAAAQFTGVTNITCESLSATQRRRQPGRKVPRH